jgi:succinate dehydrogenase / fumarate reductase, flavoprotein subunit
VKEDASRRSDATDANGASRRSGSRVIGRGAAGATPPGSKKMDFETHEYDVLVIGAGGAGLRAAIEASAAGVKVGLICKSLLGKAHTVMAEGGVAAALANVDDRDSWKVHFADTMRGGQYVNNWRMAELHAKEAPDRVRELEAWGAVFDRTPDGRILQRNFGGHRYPRLAHVGDRTGLELIRTLQDHGVHRGIDVHMEFTVVRLLKSDGRASGVVGYERDRGRFKVFSARAVVLATGGAGRAYKITSNSWEGTGDGHALAYQAGAELMDMEFIQFHPTGMIWPPSVQGILVTEGVRGEGGVLLNSDGRRFMFDSIPDNYRSQTADNEDEGWRYTQGDKNARRPPELLTRDHVARCIMREVKAGRGSPRGGVFLDISWIKKRLPDAEAHIRRKLPSMYHQFKELADIDITKEPMEIGPTTHYIMGGVRVDSDTQMSTVPGLFAAGECAAGINGANRLGGNSLSDLLVFGKRAGEYAAQFAKKNGPVAIDQREVTDAVDAAVKPFERQAAQENPYAVQSALQETMQSLVGIVRTEAEMQQALNEVKTLTSRAAQASVTGHREYNPGWHTAIDLQNLLTVSEAITRSAIERKESRGGHFREDFPEKIPEFGTFNIVTARSADGTMAVRRVPIPPIPPELKQIIEDQQK